MPKYSYRATLDEIRENDYNLNIPRYVDTFEEEDPVDIQAVKKNIADIEAELAQVQEQMKSIWMSWGCNGYINLKKDKVNEKFLQKLRCEPYSFFAIGWNQSAIY